MKKILFLSILLLLTSCASVSKTNDSKAVVTDNTETTQKQKIEFSYQGSAVNIDDDMKEVKDKIGEPKHYFEADSCAYQGKERVYIYGGMEIRTYEKEGEEYVFNIALTDNLVSTKEGLKLFMSEDKVTAIYSELEKEVGGVYIFSGYNCDLRVLTQDKKVVSIEYLKKI